MTIDRGIILAGGRSLRLYPTTRAFSKHLLAIYDKPMVYYPLCVLMLAGIRRVLLVSNPGEKTLFERLLGDGSGLGIDIRYVVQDAPRGVADAFRLGESFGEGRRTALVLGDSFFYGEGLASLLKNSADLERGARVFASYVVDPRRYGVVTLDENNRPVSLEEKPASPASSYAITGLYFYDEEVYEIARGVRPSERGELEITAVNQEYLRRGALDVQLLGRGIAWLDMGTHDSLLDASNLVATIEKRQGLKIACPEEIAYRLGFIDAAQLRRHADALSGTEYGAYLSRLLSGEVRYISRI